MSCPPRGNFPNPGTELVSFMSPALTGRFFMRLWENPHFPLFVSGCLSVSLLSCWTGSAVGPEREGDGYQPFPSTQSHRLFSPGVWDPRDPLRREAPGPQALQAKEWPAACPRWAWGPAPCTVSPPPHGLDHSAVPDSAGVHGASFQLSPTPFFAGSHRPAEQVLASPQR